MEIEAKLVVPDSATVEALRALDSWAGYQLLPGAAVSIIDSYVDTSNRAILAAGFACRLRKKPDGVLVTLKGFGAPVEGIHRREEREISIPAVSAPASWPDGPVKDEVIGMCAGKTLRPLCTIRQERFVREVMAGERHVAIQSLDAVTVDAHGDQRGWWEVEIELLPQGSEADLSVMRDWAIVTYGLSLARTSKFETAMAFLAERRARRPSPRAARALHTRTVELQAGAALETERILSTLAAMGYAPRVRASRADLAIFRDTYDGAALKKGMTLRYSQLAHGWQVHRGGSVLFASPGDPATLPETGDVAHALESIRPFSHWIVHLRAELSETDVRLTVTGALPIGLRIRRWSIASPREPVTPRVMVDLAVTSRDSSTNLAYFVSLLGARLGCRPVEETILARGLTLLDLPVPGAPLPQRFCLQSDDTLDDACRKILAGEAWRMKSCLAGALRDLDPEYVHDMRVATRRARFAAKLFEATHGPEWVASVRGELGWIAGLLGEARDLDVLNARCHELHERTEAAQDFRVALGERLRLARSSAQGALVDGLGSERFVALLRGLEDPSATESTSLTTDMSLRTFALRSIARAFDRLARWKRRPAERFSASDLHSLRILFKRLRYTCEFFSSVLGKDLAGLARAFVPYQDCLGHYQDAVAALSLLTRLSEQWAPEKPPAEILLAMGALLQVQRETWAAERRSFNRLWVSVSALSARWEKLRRGETA
jgi:CHAD domain-containing protein